MSLAEFDADLVVDARDCVMGRVATQVAERALAGDRIAVVNAEEAVITGRREDILEKYRTRAQLGSDRGPAYPRRPDRIFKRTIRGMVPYKKDRGRTALSNVRVYVGNPHDRDASVLDDTSIDRLSTTRFITLGTVAEHLGANVTW
ncbi:50S ribosomal protein L13 [Halodesulfurarchaeum formicicum]|uniref:Large ribosomal subunit protein uL13 n=1 Tax=Halodesulfurarchaeum formicicum TaxID=1873524 RepID=A0A1D8S3P8_9EURY|nr:50S ribosomal protein L13 [Halodesulfurarchaeum formicicum]AOW79961.1 50S ribosomal protein L13 [Halodesulfurarchaeum formicicum]